MCGPHIRLFLLFTFRPIASKQLNSFTTIFILSWIGGAEVTHPHWMREILGSIPGSGEGFSVLCFVLLCFYFFVQNTIFVTAFCNSLSIVHFFSILNILHVFWLIIRVQRYRHSIFKHIAEFFPCVYIAFSSKQCYFTIWKLIITKWWGKTNECVPVCFHRRSTGC